jgi:hypothetical protein
MHSVYSLEGWTVKDRIAEGEPRSQYEQNSIIPLSQKDISPKNESLAGTEDGTTYYFDGTDGDDSADGLSPATAWKSLSKIGSLTLQPGDEIKLKRETVFNNQSFELLNQKGSELAPVRILPYGDGDRPVINVGSLSRHAITITSSEYIEIEGLELTGGNGGISFTWIDQKLEYRHFVFRDLYIHDCFLSNGSAFELNMIPKGGVRMSEYSDVTIEDCRVEMIVRSFINAETLNNFKVLNNVFQHCGGPGVKVEKTNDLLIQGNHINYSGSEAHPSFKGRGSCSWIIGCRNTLVERNIFENAEGWLDSYGFHLDIGNVNTIVQYNLSRNNAGGFVQILGKNKNSSYRYNVSINDGWRVKGEYNHPTEKNIESGCIISLSGYVVNGDFEGPYNSYIYNNTVFVNEDIEACFNFRYTIDGVFIANNIFHFMGETASITGGRKPREPDGSMPQNIVFENNLYRVEANHPTGMLISDSNKLFGDAGFIAPGGFEPEHYIPGNVNLVENKSMAVYNLPEDNSGLHLGFEVDKDFLGNEIIETPDLGAIEISNVELPYASAGQDIKIDYFPVDSIVLNGRGIDDIEIVSFLWEKISGPECDLIQAATETLILKNLKEGSYIFRLTVTDNEGNTDSDEMNLNVFCEICHTPVVNAGADRIVQLPYDTVQFSGDVSLQLGNIGELLWEKISGPSASLNGADTYELVVSDLLPGTYRFSLTAISDSGFSHTDLVEMIVLEPLPPPDSIGKNSNSIVIDGIKEEAWCGKLYPVDKMVSGYFKTEVYTSFLWDETALYFFLEAEDKFKIDDSGDEWWEDDAVELSIDADNSKTQIFDGNDFNFAFSIFDSELYETVHNSTNGVEFVSVIEEEWYFLEAKIPWSLLNFSPSDFDVIGIEVRVYDDFDGLFNDAIQSLFGFSGNSSPTPDLLGSYVLGEPCPIMVSRNDFIKPELMVTPNYAKDIIRIEIKANQKMKEFFIAGMDGIIYKTGNFQESCSIDISSLEEGIYIIGLTNHNCIRRIVKL